MFITLFVNLGVEWLAEGNLNNFPKHPKQYVLGLVLVSVLAASILYWLERKKGLKSF